MTRLPRSRSTRLHRALIAVAAAALTSTALVATASAAQQDHSQHAPETSTTTERSRVNAAEPATTAAAQTLTWTADNSLDKYASVTTEATAGPATIVFENSTATGNTSGLQHTLTFDTTTEGYNHDVDLNLIAYPSDDENGTQTAEVVLTEGTYRFFCNIPGHGQMAGELVVSAGDGGGDDTTPPKVTPTLEGQQDDNDAYIGWATVSLSATDDSSGVEKIEYQLDGGAWTAYNKPFDVDTPGKHTVAYRATDKAGNVSEAGESAFTVVEGTPADVTPPAVHPMVEGETNAAGDYVGQAEVMIEATDEGSGVDTVEYALDDGEWTAYTDPVVVDQVGEHTVKYRATDKAGNASEPGTTSFTVVPGAGDDTTAPEVAASLAGEQASDWSYRGAVTATLKATDEGSGVKTVEYALDDGEWTAYSEPVQVEAVGEHTLRYRATDGAGNASEPGEVGFRIAEAASPPECAHPDPSPTVVIGDVGTGVRNRAVGGGCTIDDRIRDESRWASHDDFLAHARSVLSGLQADGYVTAAEQRAIITAARASGIGT